jgi:hypothetical protein
MIALGLRRGGSGPMTEAGKKALHYGDKIIFQEPNPPFREFEATVDYVTLDPDGRVSAVGVFVPYFDKLLYPPLEALRLPD